MKSIDGFLRKSNTRIVQGSIMEALYEIHRHLETLEADYGSFPKVLNIA